MKKRLVTALKTVVRALTKDAAQEFADKFPTKKPTDQDLQDFVDQRGYNDEEISELMYDLGTMGFSAIKKPKTPPPKKPGKLGKPVKYEFFNIIWETDDGDQGDLPTTDIMETEDPEFDIDQEGADYLSDEHGSLVESFEWKRL